jgi:hypothetical protein
MMVLAFYIASADVDGGRQRIAPPSKLFLVPIPGIYRLRHHHISGPGLIPASHPRAKSMAAICTGCVSFHAAADVMAPLLGHLVTQHPLRLNLLLLASWPHARFHPCRCSPDNPLIRKGWRCFCSVGGIIGQKIA